jgi:nitrate reductase gamma subunit
MSDYTLFVAAPYVAVLSMLVVSVVRCAAGVSRRPVDHGPITVCECLARLVTRAALAAIVGAHVALLAAPATVLEWTRSPSRLLLLESIGFCFGLVCAAAVTGSIARHVRDAANCTCRRLPELLASTVLAVAVVSGVALAVAYRWASVWATVTLTPYAVSLIHFSPRVELVAATPFLVRLHIFSSFAVAALLPFTAIGSSVLIAARRAAEHGTRKLSLALTMPRAAVSGLVKRTVRPEAIWYDEEM